MSLPLRDEKFADINVDSKHSSNYRRGDSPDAAPDRDLELLRSTDRKLKHHIRVFRLVSRVFSVLMSAMVLGTMAYALAKYLLTKNNVIAGNVHPWSNPTILWPTIMMLAISCVSLLMNLVVLLSYCCGGAKSANNVSRGASYMSYAMLAAEVLAWAVTTGLFKMANDGRDLWGWSCSPNSDAIQDQVMNFLNFGQLCTMQTGSYGVMIAQDLTYALTFLTYVIVVRRVMNKRKMIKMQEQRASMQTF